MNVREYVFEKVFQLLALKSSIGLMFPEKTVVFIVQSGLKLYNFSILAATVETSTKRSGSRFRGRGQNVVKQQ